MNLGLRWENCVDNVPEICCTTNSFEHVGWRQLLWLNASTEKEGWDAN